MSSLASDESESFARFLHTTPLGQFCRQPEIAWALAQDRLATTITPFLHLPDIFRYEERLLRDWETERPDAAAQARASAALVRAGAGGMTDDARRLRELLHRVAHRRLDAAAVGREVFIPCPPFFGEPHLAQPLRDGLTLKIGIVRMAHYWPKPESELRSQTWRAQPELIRAAESVLFPLLPPPGENEADEFSAAASLWLALAPLREFEAHKSLPLLPYTTIYPEGYVPRGYSLRIKPETMRALGGSYLTLAAAGLSPYIADPFLAYCDSRRSLLQTWIADLESLAKSKWSAPTVKRYATAPVSNS